MVKQTAGHDALGTFAPKFAELNDDVLFGEVWSREKQLSLRDRSIVTVTALMAQGLTAHASTTTPLPAPVTDPNLKLSVDLEADIASNTFGGTGIQHTGSCGESTTMLHYMKVEWE